MRNYLIGLSFLVAGMLACKINKKPNTSIEKVILEDIVVKPSPVKEIAKYQPMEPRLVDLLHTKLSLEFDYQRQWVLGQAVLKLKPYTGTLSSFELDAQGFTLLKVAAIIGKDTQNLRYNYDTTKIELFLRKAYSETDTINLFIQYIAKPNEIRSNGGKAISDSRGLYFINPLGSDPNKPRQIWSQGETEYNSCWFPTVDAPNEKHTQDIYLTVDTADETLSNGLLLDSKVQKGGKRNDHWQQLKPHAPYLTMIAIGNFIITKDKWRNKEVSYYLEPAYAPYARTIFGKTPQMIETFSKITGVDYPWDKFSQIVCRDFVSGAMENTSAVLHYEMVQHTDREHLDNTHEDIIVHELFHHWFGDLVTCRSWSNLPLNESFATYGEYLYNEATYGKNYADMIFSNNLSSYLRSKGKYTTSPIRKYYAEADDVFDVVSYQKGSWILHQLRNEVGDANFFKGLNRYLTQNAYSTTDIHHLRHAMEWASGKDLQAFFLQWFEGFGHPELKLESKYDAAKKSFLVNVKQVQDSSFGLFTIHSKLAFVLATRGRLGSVQELPVYINGKNSVIQIPIVNLEADSVTMAAFWLDPKGNIPGVITDGKDANQLLIQLKMADGYQSKINAWKGLASLPYEKAEMQQRQAIDYLLVQPEYYYQLAGLELIGKLDTLYIDYEKKIANLAANSSNVEVRDNAMYLLGFKGNSELAKSTLLKGLQDSSYGVMATVLQSLAITDKAFCLEKCKELEQYKTPVIQRSIAWLYANYSKENKNIYYEGVLGKYGFTRSSILTAYSYYLRQQNASILTEGLGILEMHYNLSSDRDKAKNYLAILKNIQAKSKETAVLEGEIFTKFQKRLTIDLREN
jgi:aminopeptidase N